MRRHVLASAVASLLVGTSCSQQDVTAPALGQPGPRSAAESAPRTTNSGSAAGVIRMAYEDGRWVEFDLNSNSVRSSNGTEVTDVPADTLAMLATEAGQEVSFGVALGSNPPPTPSEPPCWVYGDDGRITPCSPVYDQSTPGENGPEDGSKSGAGATEAPILVRLPSLPGAPVSAFPGARLRRGTLSTGVAAATLNSHPCDSHLSALTVAYAAFYRGESVFKGGAWALSGATSLAVNNKIGWRDIAPSVLQDVMIGYASRMINRIQIAALHVIGNSYLCQARSPISVDVAYTHYNQPGVGQPPISAGITRYTRTCADMDVEVSTDGGETWTTVHVKVCEIQAA